MRYTASMTLGLLTASLLFWVMTQLILVETEFVSPPKTTPLILYQVQEDTVVKPKKRQIERPKKVIPPPVQRVQLAYQGQAPVIPINPVILDSNVLKSNLPIGEVPVPDTSDIQSSSIPMTDLDIERKAPVHYPRSALNRGIEGMVLIENTIDANGKVIRVNILKSSHRVLETPVRVSAMKWQYAKSDLPERVHATKVEFQLTD